MLAAAPIEVQLATFAAVREWDDDITMAPLQL